MSRSNGYTSYRGGSTARPSSAELVEIHVYIVPPDVWREHYNNLLNQQVTELISAGIIRVHGEQKLCVLRDDIVQQIGADLLPRDFVFLRGVGRSITKLRTKQEYQLKAKHFALPIAHTPELYLLEISPEERDRSSQGSTRPQTRSPVYTNNESEDERQSSKAKQMHSSPYRYSPLPKIRSSKSPPRQMSPPKQYSSHRQISPSKQRSVPNSERSPPNDRHYQNNMTPQDEVMPQRQMTAQSHNTPLRQRSPDGPLNVEQNGDIRSEHIQFYESVDSNRDRQSVSRSHRSSRQSPPPKEEQPTARLSATPPHSADRQRKPYKSDKYDAYTNHTNEDSGINVLTPEDQYEADRRKHEEEQRQQDLQKRLQPADEDDRENGQRRLQDEQDDDEWERRRREEEERRQREEEERRRREEERRRREEEENRRAEEERRRLQEDRDRMAKEQKFSGSDEDLNRFPSPPPMHRNERDTESGKLQRKEEIEKLKKELEAAREQRRLIEKQREELVKKAKLMQTKTQNRRNHARDIWKKRYFEEKKKTPPLEEQCNRLRHELDIIHRKLMNTLEGPTKEKSTRTADLKPSQKNNYKIQATRLTHEIDDVRRRLENAKMKLTAEMKLRNQAETELRALRAELTQKKIHLTLSRNQQLAAMTPATSQELYTAPALTPRS